MISRSETSPILRNLSGSPLINSWNRQQIGLRCEKETLRGIDSGNDECLNGRMTESASGEHGARAEDSSQICVKNA
jgi:hypothetical protein